MGGPLGRPMASPSTVPGVGEARDGRVLAGAGEEALGVFGREAGEDGEGGVDQAVALGVDGAYRVTVIGDRGFEDAVEGVVEVLGGGGFVGGGVLRAAVEVHGDRGPTHLSSRMT